MSEVCRDRWPCDVLRSRPFVTDPGDASSCGAPGRHRTTLLKQVALCATVPAPFAGNKGRCGVGEPGKEDEVLEFYTREHSFGHFRRTINLPDGVDGGKMDAGFVDGLLEIIIEGGANPPEPQRVRIRSQVG